jgi:hypothetical protein
VSNLDHRPEQRKLDMATMRATVRLEEEWADASFWRRYGWLWPRYAAIARKYTREELERMQRP